MLGALPLNFLLNAYIFVALSAVLAGGVRLVGRARSEIFPASAELRVHYFLLALLAVLLVIPLPKRAGAGLRPVAHVELSRAPARVPAPPVVKLTRATVRSPGLRLDVCLWAALLLAFAGGIVTAADYLRLCRLLRRGVIVRKVGRVRIAVLDGIPSPFSTRLRHAWVVLPAHTLGDPAGMRIALAHELQHHRAGDTLWVHAMAALRALCFFHPLRLLWAAALAEAQELACDEVLVEQKRISAGNYSRCLLHAAESAAREGAGRANAAAPALFSARRLLARRIERMYRIENAKKRNGRPLAVGLALLAGVTLAAGAWASGTWIVDSRISAATMEQMARDARAGTDFPVEVNGRVLEELNRYLGSAAGREYVARARENLARLRPLLDRELSSHGAPAELLAVGLVESGFRNLPQSANPTQHGAGVWQFIPSTARVFGMRVDAQVDERLDVERETDAAFRYLTSLERRFGDWRLALMAYNMGERRLDAAIQRTGTRDPWKLIRLGYENDADYLAKVMAGVLLLKSSKDCR